MQTSALRPWVKWAWVIVPAVTALALVSAGLVPLSAQSPSKDPRADPAQFLSGTLDASAVAAAQSFAEFPLVWLGEEFEGYKLTAFVHRKHHIPKEETRYHSDFIDNSVSLVYGSCVPERTSGLDAPSCVPPLVITITAPGIVPGPRDVAEEAAGPMSSIRGLTVRELSGSPVLWTDSGVTIFVNSNDDVRGRALESLRMANAARVGLPDIEPGQSLAPLNP